MMIKTDRSFKLALLLAVCVLVPLGSSYEQMDSSAESAAYYEENSHYPILHVYYNRHFAKSRQFQDFKYVIEETQYKIGEFTKFLFTDCEVYKESNPETSTHACQSIKRNNDNRMLISNIPSNQFIRFGNKVLQSPPQSRIYDHQSDVYTSEEIQRFLEPMIPNFFGEISNAEQFNRYRQEGRYVPKLIFATRDDELPLVLKQLGVAYFLKFDFAMVDDLTESIVQDLKIKKFPALIVLKYNYVTEVEDLFFYPETDFSANKYDAIKKFLEPHALRERRNDHLFHMIKGEKFVEIITVDNRADLTQQLERSNGWAIVSETKELKPEKLMKFKEKYQTFFNYIHLVDSSLPSEQKIFLYNQEDFKGKRYPVIKQELEFATLSLEYFKSNMSLAISRDQVVVGVREEYAHVCSLSEKILFKGLVQCLIMKESDYDEISHSLNMKFKIGFVVSQLGVDDGKGKGKDKGKDKGKSKQGKTIQEGGRIHGNVFDDYSYYAIYRIIEYSVRTKVKETIDRFLDNPITQITQSQPISQLCNLPNKLCAFMLTDPTKPDRTKVEYLKEVARDFINQYLFFEVNIDCNLDLLDQLEAFEKNSGGLFIYHPLKVSYVRMKTKLTKSMIEKFLRVNIKEDKRLVFEKFLSETEKVYRCVDKAKAFEQEKEKWGDSESNSFAEEL